MLWVQLQNYIAASINKSMKYTAIEGYFIVILGIVFLVLTFTSGITLILEILLQINHFCYNKSAN